MAGIGQRLLSGKWRDSLSHGVNRSTGQRAFKKKEIFIGKIARSALMGHSERSEESFAVAMNENDPSLRSG